MTENSLLPACPNFAAHPIVYKLKVGMWECLECEIRFEGAAPQKTSSDNSQLLTSKTANPKVIFFSYGHDNNKELVDRFKNDLGKRGHTVWIDYKEIGNWSDWKGKITQGIHDSDLALAFLSKHATRDPGVCSNEIAMALNRFGTVYPILLEPASDVTPPVTISHLQWQDLSQWRDIRDGKVEGKEWARWYEEKLIQIITLLEGEASEFEGDIKSLREVLKPVSFTSDIARHIPEFSGREWVFEAYQDWLDNQPKSRLFWIKAGPGVGKTAIAAMLAHTRQSAVVGAWFCQANSIERRDTHKALCSLAFHLASRWDDYRRKLRYQLGFNASTRPDDWKDLRDALLKMNEADLFNFLFAEPLTGLIWRDHRLAVVIDALDEASDSNGQNPLVDLLVTRLAHLPSWLNFVVTSRPNPEVVAKLQGFAPFELDTEDQRNRDDLKAYIDTGLAKRADFSALPVDEQTRIKTILLDNSEGMILYLQQILKGLEEGVILLNTIEHIPRGLGSLYRIAFDHHYGGDKLQAIYDGEVKPLLRLLLAAPEPLPPALAQQVIGWDKETYLRRRNRLGAYVLDTPQGCKLFHKTLYEWLSDEASTPYYLEQTSGKIALAKYLWQCFDRTDDEYELDWSHQIKHWLPSLMPLLPQWEDATALNNLGLYLHKLAQNSEAEVFYRRALVLSEKSLGSEHLYTATTINNLGTLLYDQGDYAAAEPLYRRALAIWEKTLGPEHTETAAGLGNLASLLRKQGDYTGAEPLFRRALDVFENQMGADHPDTAIGLNNLGKLLEFKGDYIAAEPLYQRALEIRENFFGPEHPETALGLCFLAGLMNSQGDFAGAAPLYRRAMKIRENKLGTEHPSTVESINELGTALYNQGDFAGAEPLYRRSLEIREKVYGSEHPKIADGLNNLAVLLEIQGNYAAAEQMHRRALSIREKSLGPEHPDTAYSLINLALCLTDQGDHAAAEQMIRRSLEIREKILGPEHPEVATSLSHLAAHLNNQGDDVAAEPLYSRALAIAEKSIGPEHPYTLSHLQDLALLLLGAGRLDEASPMLRESVSRHIRVHGEDDLKTATTFSALGYLLKLKGELAEAASYYRKALAIRERELGVDAESTKLVKNRLDELLEIYKVIED